MDEDDAIGDHRIGKSGFIGAAQSLEKRIDSCGDLCFGRVLRGKGGRADECKCGGYGACDHARDFRIFQAHPPL